MNNGTSIWNKCVLCVYCILPWCVGNVKKIQKLVDFVQIPTSKSMVALLLNPPDPETAKGGLGPSKYPRFQVYMGLLVKGIIPTLPPSSRWMTMLGKNRGFYLSNLQPPTPHSIWILQGPKRHFHQVYLVKPARSGNVACIHQQHCMYKQVIGL